MKIAQGNQLSDQLKEKVFIAAKAPVMGATTIISDDKDMESLQNSTSFNIKSNMAQQVKNLEPFKSVPIDYIDELRKLVYFF